MSVTTIYIAIGVSFLLNLIIVIAFRAADRKDKNMKMVNERIKAFRNEMTQTLSRLNSTARDCEQNITSRVEHASSVQEHLAESIDLVLVHQRELDDLSGVCENYGNALKKLKVQTEQAENRLYAVQAEVRKIEAVNEYAVQFQKETERLTAQMDSLKSDYVRLVASTEQDLKAASQSQKEENNEMLTLFSQSLERAKIQFSDYIAGEKKGWDDICRREEAEAQARLESLSRKADEADAASSRSREELESCLLDIKAKLDELELRKDAIMKDAEEKSTSLDSDRNAAVLAFENRRDAIFKEYEERIAKCTEDLESAVRSTENTLEADLRDKEEEIAASIENYTEKLSEKEKAVEGDIEKLTQEKEKVLEEFSERFDALKKEASLGFDENEERKKAIISDCSAKLDERRDRAEEEVMRLKEEKSRIEAEFDETIREKKDIFESELASLETKRTQYRERCEGDLSQVVENAHSTAGVLLSKLKSQGEEFLRAVSSATGDSEEAYRILTETAHGKIREAETTLADLRNKIRETEAELSEQVEKVTKVKEEIWNLQQEQKNLENEVSSLEEDRTKLQSARAQAKNDRISEEANLVRLKGQQRSLREENKEKSEPKKSLFEEMDVVIGPEEDVDVFDDDDL